MMAWDVVLSTAMLMLVSVAFLWWVAHEACVPPEDKAMLGSNLSAARSQRCMGGGESFRHLSSFLPSLQCCRKAINPPFAYWRFMINKGSVSRRSVLGPVCRGLCSRGFFETCFARISVRLPNTGLPWFLSLPWLPFASGVIGSFVAVCSGSSSR